MLEFRRLKPEEEEEFLKEKRKVVYPELSQRQFKKWMEEEEEPYSLVNWVIVKNGQIIGGVGVGLYDYLNKKRVLLELETFWIKKGYQREGFGRRLLKKTFEEVGSYYRKYGLVPVGIIIQTTSLDEKAEDFYRKSIDFPYSVIKQEIAGVEITVFLVSFLP